MARYDIAPVDFEVDGARIGIAAARFNSDVVDRLLEGAQAALAEHGIDEDDINVVRVPGAFELPLAARWLLEEADVDGVVVLGAVIRGDTPHFDYVCAEAARGVTLVSQDFALPVTFGVLTTDDHAQAMARAGGGHGHVGREATLALLEMLSLLRALAEDAAADDVD